MRADPPIPLFSHLSISLSFHPVAAPSSLPFLATSPPAAQAEAWSGAETKRRRLAASSVSGSRFYVFSTQYWKDTEQHRQPDFQHAHSKHGGDDWDADDRYVLASEGENGCGWANTGIAMCADTASNAFDEGVPYPVMLAR